ncbi:hypothetical protein BLA29_001324 [Euroglyphus maynei]|uniref:Claspin-like protein n=1 Tax=Euroglyphus maynei TaxID=6958 RepID=A0A1Y3AM99_EURMA|nr:hypothetical protein BLA29_001324 [Euroglyphus maynei]
MLLELCSGRFNDDVQTKIKRPKSLKIRDFLEEEAELSGDEDEISSDESDGDNDDEEFIENLIEEDNELPHDDELREQVEKIHHKNMLDEDKRQMMILKEHFFDDGDLYDDGHNRRKKFKWTLNRDDNDLMDFANTVDDSDSENGDSIDEEEQDHDHDGQTNNNNNDVIRLKRTIEQISEDDDQSKGRDDDINAKKIRLIKLNSMKFLTSNRKKNQSSLTSFIIRDQRLKEVMKNSDESLKAKKTKTNDSISIFDVINQ